MTSIKVTRTPGRENEHGDLEFRMTVPAESVAAFLIAYPGFELVLTPPATPQVAEDTPSGSPLIRGSESNPHPVKGGLGGAHIPPLIEGGLGGDENPTKPPPQSLAPQSVDSCQIGLDDQPHPDVANLCRLPTYQDYVLEQIGANPAEIEDIDLYTVKYMETIIGKPFHEITERDYLNLLFPPFGRWMMKRGSPLTGAKP